MSEPEPEHIPILAVLKPKDREKILASAKRRTWAAGDVVVREGESALNLFLIESGRAHVQHADGASVGTIEAGDFFGELGLIVEHPRTATIVADTTLTCVLLPAWEFRSLLEEHPEMAIPMLRKLIARLHGVTPHEH
jgi:CRP-like cAMP-binding protein